MSDFKAQCGCAIHVVQWTSKRKIASVKYCETHKAKPLDAEIVELRKDRDRLDWLRGHSNLELRIDDPAVRYGIRLRLYYPAEDLRSVIDAAMAEGKGAE